MSDRLVLAIESSCDETAAAVVRGRTVLGEVVASQAVLHDRFGGVVPEIASRRHLELVDDVVAAALDDAGIDRLDELDAVAVTRGPGLVGALLVGIAAGKSRAWAAGLPLIAVDHLLGHVASALLDPDADLDPPFLCLLVSGGHTLVLDVDEDMRITLLGSTRDDAAGEAFDKGARLFGLPMPGGPSLARLADSHVRAREDVAFTPAMVHHQTLDTSFAGIKTALAVALRERAETGAGPGDAELASAYQEAIVATIAACARKLVAARGAGSGHPQERSQLALVGGVAANARLRDELEAICARTGMRSVRTPIRWCGDNAAMIGVAAQWGSLQTGTAAMSLDAYATSPLFRTRQLLPT